MTTGSSDTAGFDGPASGPSTPLELPGLIVIGTVRSQYTDRVHTPIQSALNASETGVVEVEPRFAPALEGLAEFDYAWLLSWLGGGFGSPPAQHPLRQVPFLLQDQQREIGVLATRGPRRVNPIGLSLVRLLGVDGSVVRFAGVDLVDGTPIVDIKPFVARFDRPAGAVACGWFDTVDLAVGATPASLGSQPVETEGGY